MFADSLVSQQETEFQPWIPRYLDSWTLDDSVCNGFFSCQQTLLFRLKKLFRKKRGELRASVRCLLSSIILFLSFAFKEPRMQRTDAPKSNKSKVDKSRKKNKVCTYYSSSLCFERKRWHLTSIFPTPLVQTDVQNGYLGGGNKYGVSASEHIFLTSPVRIAFYFQNSHIFCLYSWKILQRECFGYDRPSFKHWESHWDSWWRNTQSPYQWVSFWWAFLQPG